MEKYITYESVDDKRGQVTKIIERPAEEQLEETGFYVEVSDFPVPDPPEGMISRLMVSLPENELYYDYVATPAPIDQQVEELRTRQDATEAAILAIMDVTTGA